MPPLRSVLCWSPWVPRSRAYPASHGYSTASNVICSEQVRLTSWRWQQLSSEDSPAQHRLTHSCCKMNEPNKELVSMLKIKASLIKRSDCSPGLWKKRQLWSHLPFVSTETQLSLQRMKTWFVSESNVSDRGQELQQNDHGLEMQLQSTWIPCPRCHSKAKTAINQGASQTRTGNSWRADYRKSLLMVSYAV